MNNKTIIKKGEEMIDQLHKILNEYDANKIDAMLNIDGIDWISKFDNEMVKNGYAVIKDGKASVKMSPNETKLFLTVKLMGMHQVRFLLDALQKMTKSIKMKFKLRIRKLIL